MYFLAYVHKGWLEKFMKVLIAVDGSEHSDYALSDLANAIWSEDTEFKLVTVADDGFGHPIPSQADGAQKLLEEAASKLQKDLPSGCKISGEILHGEPRNELVHYAEKWTADLIIVGSRGRKGLTRMLLGSVSHAVLMAAPCAVKISRKAKVDGENRKVIIALDDSSMSERLVERICSRRWNPNTQFICITVVPAIAQYVYGIQDPHDMSSLEEVQKEKIDVAKVCLEKACKTITEKIPGTKASFEVVEGDAREIIVERAKEYNAMLIVIGHKGKNLMDRLLIGSVSEAVATWADCSVLVVK